MREHTALLLASTLLLVGLSLPLTEPDEVRYAEIPIAMEASGSWVVPTLHGQPYLDKPPLHYWLVAAASQLALPTTVQARLPSALAALLGALAVWILGRRLFGRRLALTAAAILLLLPGYQVAAHYANLDALFTLFTTVAQLALWIGLRERRSDLRWVALGGAAAGLAILTKGPAALAITLPPMLVWDWLRGRRPRLGAWALFVGASLAVAAPWFVAVTRLEPGFWQHFFVHHHLERVFGTLEHQRPWWFFGPIFLAGIFPFTFWLPPAARALFSIRADLRTRRDEELGIAFLAAVWPVVLFSLSSGKLASYILPAFPFVAIVVAWYLNLDLEERRRSVLRRLAPFAAAGSLSLSLLWLDHGSRPYFVSTGREIWVLWLTVWGLGLAAVWACGMRQRLAALLAAGLLNAQIFLAILPAMAQTHSLVGRAAIHSRNLSTGERRLEILLLADDGDPVLLSGKRPVSVWHQHPENHDAIESLLDDHGELILVSEPDHLEWLQRQPERYSLTEIDGRGHVFHLRWLARAGGS